MKRRSSRECGRAVSRSPEDEDEDPRPRSKGKNEREDAAAAAAPAPSEREALAVALVLHDAYEVTVGQEACVGNLRGVLDTATELERAQI